GKQACDVIFGEEQLSNCKHLQIGEDSGGKVLAARLATYPFARLRQLAVSGLLAGEAGGIARNEQLAHLETLRISNARLSPRDVAELMHGPWRTTLRALGLYGSSRDADLEPWGDIPSFDRLLRLDLGGDLLTQHAFSGNLIGLLLCCRFPSLQELRLTWCGLRPGDFDTLVQAELPELRRLDLRGTRTVKRDILRLLKPALFPKLRRIHVDQPVNLGDYDGPVQVG
ncbi:MAG: hypothetical protein KDB14_27940, partial [Planctomycetales bacterium]|nr:hypothetical protein [Planctomycetales bacterium]